MSSRRMLDFHQPPEQKLYSCEWCNDETLEFVPSYMGHESHYHCINEDCPGDPDDLVEE